MRRSSVVRTTCNSFRVRRFVHPVQIGCQRYYGRAVQPETAPKLFTKSKSSIVEPEELMFSNDKYDDLLPLLIVVLEKLARRLRNNGNKIQNF